MDIQCLIRILKAYMKLLDAVIECYIGFIDLCDP